MWVDIGRVIKGIDLDDLDDYAIRYVVSYVDVGEVCEDCATESDAIECVATLRAAGFTVKPTPSSNSLRRAVPA